MRTLTCTLDNRDVEADIEVTAYHPAERQTWDDPGAAAEVEFDVVAVRVDGEPVELRDVIEHAHGRLRTLDADDAEGLDAVLPDGRVVQHLTGPGAADGHGAVRFSRIGKAAAGRLLDGREHNGFPVAVVP